jgi:hypothetical protein
MIRYVMASALGLIALAATTAPASAQSPFAKDYPTSYFPPSYPSYWYYTPKELAQLSSPMYTNTWQPAMPLPPYQLQAWGYWYRTAYAPYMQATGYQVPFRP